VKPHDSGPAHGQKPAQYDEQHKREVGQYDQIGQQVVWNGRARHAFYQVGSD
jgi:hypothetical protein